jgi:hypothetical protein
MYYLVLFKILFMSPSYAALRSSPLQPNGRAGRCGCGRYMAPRLKPGELKNPDLTAVRIFPLFFLDLHALCITISQMDRWCRKGKVRVGVSD